MTAIACDHLSKTYKVPVRDPGLWNAAKSLFYRRTRDVEAVKDVCFEVAPGEVVGFLGPNGAGKTTTLKMLSGLLQPTDGHVEVLGLRPFRRQRDFLRHITLVMGNRNQLVWDIPVADSFERNRAIYRLERPAFTDTVDMLVELLDLSTLLSKPVRNLSLGERMKCEVAAALLHRPQILFLDEPTIGLAAVSKLAVRDFIKKLNREQNVTVILTTHDMDDIEALCTRVLVIGQGQILSDGTLEDLRAKVTRERRLIVDLEGTEEISDPDAVVVAKEGHRVQLTFDPERVPTADLIGRITAKHPVRDLFGENTPIEEIISRLYAEHH